MYNIRIQYPYIYIYNYNYIYIIAITSPQYPTTMIRSSAPSKKPPHLAVDLLIGSRLHRSMVLPWQRQAHRNFTWRSLKVDLSTTWVVKNYLLLFCCSGSWSIFLMHFTFRSNQVRPNVVKVTIIKRTFSAHNATFFAWQGRVDTFTPPGEVLVIGHHQPDKVTHLMCVLWAPVQRVGACNPPHCHLVKNNGAMHHQISSISPIFR